MANEPKAELATCNTLAASSTTSQDIYGSYEEPALRPARRTAPQIHIYTATPPARRAKQLSAANYERHKPPARRPRTPDAATQRQANMSKLAFDYSKWDNIEISDDEADTHPNIDKASWFRMKHRSRVEREDQRENQLVLCTCARVINSTL